MEVSTFRIGAMNKIGQWWGAAAVLVVLWLGATPLRAQTCYSRSDIEPATLSALQNAASGYLQSARAGNVVALQSAAEFDLGDVVTVNKDLWGNQENVRATYLLDNTQSQQRGPGTGGEFYCGIYNSPNRVGFIFGGLPAGRYAIVIEDVSGGRTPAVISWILHQNGAQWRMAGLYVKPAQIGGHDAAWYLAQARAYRAKGQNHNAWFYYLMVNELTRPFPAMSTPQLDKLYDEMQAVRPADLPSKSNPVGLAAGGGRVFKMTDLFPLSVGNDLDVVVKYEEPDISDTGKTFQDNMAVIKALVAKYPELRDAFGGVVARAVAPNGQDYGSLLAMKDVK
jgi:hypothetical protein